MSGKISDLDHARQEMDGCCSNKFDNLPREILTEILLRSSIESLMRLKCLNKSWYFLIRCLVNDPKFVAKHFRRSEASPAMLLLFNHKRRVFVDEKNAEEDFLDEIVTSARLTRFVDDGDDDRVHCIAEELNFPCFLKPRKPYELTLCYCNGVICLTRNFRTVTLYNPMLREFDTFDLKTDFPKDHFLGMGFGYDLESCRFKIVTLLDYMKAEVFVPGTNSDSWREIEMDIRGYCTSAINHTYLEGNCYWLYGSPETVLCFNVGSESFRNVPVPNDHNTPPSKLILWSLHVRNDAICIVSNSDEAITMWEMSRDHCSWTKLLRAEPFPELYISLSFWKLDELLVCREPPEVMGEEVATHNLVSSYNIRTRKLRRLSIDVDLNGVYYLERYAKSLVSVKRLTKYEH